MNAEDDEEESGEEGDESGPICSSCGEDFDHNGYASYRATSRIRNRPPSLRTTIGP